MSNLKCGDCGMAIRGKTGFQEVENLRKHLAKRHDTHVGISDALEIRLLYENGGRYLASRGA